MNKLPCTQSILQYSSPRPAGDTVQSSSSTFQRPLDRSSASLTRSELIFTVNDPPEKPCLFDRVYRLSCHYDRVAGAKESDSTWSCSSIMSQPKLAVVTTSLAFSEVATSSRSQAASSDSFVVALMSCLLRRSVLEAIRLASKVSIRCSRISQFSAWV